jgi:hypothetical protein
MRKVNQPERCSKCGVVIYGDPALRPMRLCDRHLHEARLASGPFGCSTAAIDEGYGEPLPPEPKGKLRAFGLTHEATCCLCGAPLSDGEWAVRMNGGGIAQPSCAGDAGWEIE